MQDFEQQRRQAEERVKEMNRVYRQKAEQANKNAKEKEALLHTKNDEQENRQNAPFDVLKMLKLDSLKSDPDRLLLLGIFLLLSNQGADKYLLYALLYIML